MIALVLERISHNGITLYKIQRDNFVEAWVTYETLKKESLDSTLVKVQDGTAVPVVGGPLKDTARVWKLQQRDRTSGTVLQEISAVAFGDLVQN